MTALTRSQWQQREAAHRLRAEQWVKPHLERRTHGEKHPVWDFLFEYYRLRPTHLKRWHPGASVELLDAADTPLAHARDYVLSPNGTVSADIPGYVERRREGLEWMYRLLRGTQNNPAHFDCFGLHEWAMVYQTDAPRHDLPLRLGAEGSNMVVDKHRIKCTHFDAFRFFTPAARPLNLTVLTRETQHECDQPGCVHATMDLYKWATKMGPIVPGELLLDCFEVATKARRLDMEASPYDCRGLGFGVVAIETPEGKAEYVERQRALAQQGIALRARLVALLETVLN